MRRTQSRALRLTILVFAAALLLSACRGGGASGQGTDAPGVSDSQITIGSSYPLSGPLAANGTAAMGAAKAYFDAVNQQGGVEMADGQTRKINFIYYDDGYDPARTVQNYQKLTTQDNVFALFQTFGTAPNLAIMESANGDQVPQLFVHSGAAVFSRDQEENPYTIGWQPTYETEGATFGEFLAARNEPVTVAIISQNDDLGEAYVSGFKKAIQGSQVKVVGEETYEATDPTLDSQVSKLSATNADVLFSAVAIPKLAAGALSKSQQLGWSPEHMLVSLVSSTDQVINPSGLDGSSGIYSTAFLKAADDPQWAQDQDVQEYVDRMRKSAPRADYKIPNATWGYGAAATLVKALEESEEVSRDSLMDAVHNISGTVPLMLPGLELEGSMTAPPLQELHIQQFQEDAWQPVG